MGMKHMKLNKAIKSLEAAMETHWEAVANMEERATATEENVSYISQEIEQEHKVGAVFITTFHGQHKWFDLETMSF